MARPMSEFRQSIRALASELVKSVPTTEVTEPTPAGLVRYHQIAASDLVSDAYLESFAAREIIARTINAELRAAAIEAATSLDRRAAELAALVRAAGIDPHSVLQRLGVK